MKPSSQDRTEGKLHEVKGRIKEEVGKATNDRFGSLRQRGKKSRHGSKMGRSCRESCRRIENVPKSARKSHRRMHVTNGGGKNG